MVAAQNPFYEVLERALNHDAQLLAGLILCEPRHTIANVAAIQLQQVGWTLAGEVAALPREVEPCKSACL